MLIGDVVYLGAKAALKLIESTDFTILFHACSDTYRLKSSGTSRDTSPVDIWTAKMPRKFPAAHHLTLESLQSSVPYDTVTVLTSAN